MQYEIRAKRKDTGKWWGFGRITKSKEYGNLQIGMKKTQELMDYLNSVQIGGYINFSLFEPKDKPQAAPAAELDDTIPF